jgi:hypothetical protein
MRKKIHGMMALTRGHRIIFDVANVANEFISDVLLVFISEKKFVAEKV